MTLDSHLNMIPFKIWKKQREYIGAPQACVFFQVGGEWRKGTGDKKWLRGGCKVLLKDSIISNVTNS